MRVGTKSVLFGVHSVLVHPWLVAAAWWKLFGFPWDARLWLCFAAHDLGYWGCPNVEGCEGEDHVLLGGRILRVVGGASWETFCLCHSRNWAKKTGLPISRLCVADKLAFVLTPPWLYLLLARASGELREYMQRSAERQAGGER